jgi:hypothetical protein
MTVLRRALFTALLALTATGPAVAQMQSGSILVRVTDDQGAAVPGVAVTLTSPVLVAGSMSGVTDGAGTNRFPSLLPGVYSVRLELQGFKTVVRENVTVQVGATVPLDLQMPLATVAETVTVTGASPVIDTTSANTSVNLGEQLLQGTAVTSGRSWSTRCRACSSPAPTSAARRVACRGCSTRAARRARRTRAS